MQFKHPEILYALFLLLIPIIVHLFQLRKFQKVPFTNVAFLKKVISQTRKSSQIKKWLVLTCRLLALMALILAFAQPYIPTQEENFAERQNIIYLDNSFSMQAQGREGSLLERNIQDLYNAVSESEHISFFTNDEEGRNLSTADFKRRLLKISPSSQQLDPQAVILKAEQLTTSHKSLPRRLIYVSDFQNIESFPTIPRDMEITAVQNKGVKPQNISIDSAYISAKGEAHFTLKALISRQGEAARNVSVSLYEQETLIGKTSVSFSDKSSALAEFQIPVQRDKSFNGKLELVDPYLPFDNQFYFSINKSEKINVLAINGADDDFLKRLYTTNIFRFETFPLNQLEYSKIPEQHFIILNGLETINTPLLSALREFKNNGGQLLFIPNTDGDVTSYSQFLSAMNLGSISGKQKQEKKITGITFSHPLYEDVFEKEIQNFQYPKVQEFFQFASGASTILQYEDRTPFLIEKDGVYVFSAALTEANSNFTLSPLIVPTLYNMALQSLPLPDLYYTIGQTETVAIPVQAQTEGVLKLKSKKEDFIPQQQSRAHYVTITTTDLPSEAGHYEVVYDQDVLQTLSYNYSRTESQLIFADPSQWEGAKIYDSVDNLFSYVRGDESLGSLWKSFVIFALILLLCEMLILKYFR